MNIAVLIADAQNLFSGALAGALERRFHIAVLGHRPTSWPEAIQAVISLKPDVAILDYWMEGADPSEALQEIARQVPECKVLSVSGMLSHQQLNSVLAAGAVGCLPKSAPLEYVAGAIRRAYRGESPVYPEEMVRFVSGLDKRHEVAVEMRRRLQSLTPRQLQVLTALSSGLRVKELADQLSVSPETIKRHVKAILRKTGTRSQTEVVTVARDCGFMQD